MQRGVNSSVRDFLTLIMQTKVCDGLPWVGTIEGEILYEFQLVRFCDASMSPCHRAYQR